jgi:hypothetical protein
MKKTIILLALVLSSFVYSTAQNYNSYEPQSVEISTNEISVDDLFSYAKEWTIVYAGIADNATRDKLQGWYNIQTSYVTEDFNSKKVYGLLKYSFVRGIMTVNVATFKLIISCKENKVKLTLCGGHLETINDKGGSLPAKMKNTDGDMEWEQLKTSFTIFFNTTIYTNY